jgi:nucleoid-associated protein YgaU
MFVKLMIRTSIVAALGLVFWSVAARPSGAHGPKTVYRVQPYDTLWTIATAHYGGDVRSAVWQIETANHLATTMISPGEKLILP